MKINSYQKNAMTTCMPTCSNWSYAAGLLHEEAGELQGKINKAIRRSKAVINGNHLALIGTPEENEALKAEMKKELGDVMWAAACIAQCMGWELEDVCWRNLEKLASRKERGVIDGQGDNR